MMYGALRVSEDVIRQNAGALLKFQDSKYAKSGVGQITTFNELGFSGVNKKPDGWYFPHDINEVAIILETKAYEPNSNLNQNLPQLQEYINITRSKYNQVIGILYNGNEAIIYKNDKFYREDSELFSKDYYLKLFTQSSIDKPKIYLCTKSINDNLHINFGINNLKHRMIFTACALVADRKGANLAGLKGRDFATLQSEIIKTLESSYSEQKALNLKLDIIKEQFNLISFNYTKNQKAIDSFIDDVVSISGYIKAESWNGEDVMGIFFNEFTRYKGKSEAGQVFTPDHITSLMYRIANVSYKDKILDACCGSGAFLVKAMNNMINEVGGNFNESAVKIIQNDRLFGIEFDKELFALACANMLIHKDGKTNLTHDDARSEAACEWIKSKNITKVLMNPPYENKFGCLKIVKNVLDNVEDGAICAFLLPSNKLEVGRKQVLKWLKKHSLLKIIKLPKEVFARMKGANETSIFIFKAHEPQGNKEIFGCYIKEDGLETVKNQGRHDLKGKWQELEDYWVDVIYKQGGDESCQWIKPNESLQYKMPEPKFEITEQDFKKVVLDYMLFENGIDKKEFEKTILDSVLYGSEINLDDDEIKIKV